MWNRKVESLNAVLHGDRRFGHEINQPQAMTQLSKSPTPRL